MILVGYESDSKAYRFWSPGARSVVVSVSVRFDESCFPRRLFRFRHKFRP